MPKAHGAREPESALAASVVRIIGQDAAIGGAGFLITSKLVLTCAHVVSNALGRPTSETVAAGTTVSVDLPLADGVSDARKATAEVRDWVPIRADETGDVALLRLHEPIPGARPLPMTDPESVWDHGTRAVGFTAAHPDGIWHRGRLRGATGRGWVQLSRADGQAVHVGRGFSGGPVWDDDLGAAVGMVVVAQPVRKAQQAFVMRTRTLIREMPELADVLLPPAPFRGLAAFREADAPLFFGRDKDVSRVVAALAGDRPSVAVYGPSGCGKSSLALAGVVPRMRQAGYEVLVVDCGLAASPREALATDLFEVARAEIHGSAHADGAEQVEHRLRETLTDPVHRVTGRPAARLLVVLDQAEALLNLPEQQLADAMELLFPQRRPAGLRVLVTLRADFMDTALSDPHLGPVLQSGVTLPLTPMTVEQLRAVIIEPLKLVPAVEYDPGLDRRILDDAGGEQGILPLLGFVLEQLWERRAAGRLRAASYDEIGGVTGALGRHAAEAWRTCVGDGDEEDAQRLLRGLVRVLPGGVAPLKRALTREEAGEGCWRLAKVLAAEWRLLVLNGGDGRPENVELAHESLITTWPALAGAVEGDREFLAGRAEVQHDLERWRRAGRPAGLLRVPAQFEAGAGELRKREADLTGEQREFLALAHRRRRMRRARQRARWVAAALALAAIAGLGTFLVQESKVSAQREAEGLSRALAIRSDELTDHNAGQAALAAIAAYEIAPTQEARSALMRRHGEMRTAAWALTGTEGKVKAASTNADGTVTLVTTDGGRATLFVRTAEGEVRQRRLRLDTNVMSPVVSRDGRRIAYLRGADGGVVWHDVTATSENPLGPAHPLQGVLKEASTAGKIMDFSPDARRLVAVSAPGSKRAVQVWDLETGRPRALPERIADVEEVWFGPDDNTLVAKRSGGLEGKPSMAAIDIGRGTMRELADDVATTGHGVSRDGTAAVVCRADGTSLLGDVRYEVIRVADGRVLSRYVHEKSVCKEVAIANDGDRFAVHVIDGEWEIVDASARRGSATPFLNPSSGDLDAIMKRKVGHLPLLGTETQPILVTRDESGVTGWALAEGGDGGAVVSSPPRLLGDGGRMVTRVGVRSDRLHVVETEGERRTLAEVDIDHEIPPSPWQTLQINPAETLMADVSDRNRITVRALPSLRRVAEFTTAMPAAGKNGEPEPLDFRFLGDDRLVTVAGARAEHWDARQGRRVSQPIDLRELRLTTQNRPNYQVRPHSEPGYLMVTVHGEPHVHAVDLRTGKENEELRVRLGDDLVVAAFLEDAHYVSVMTVGGMVELWSVFPGRKPERTVGPLGPLNRRHPDGWAAGSLGNAGFFLANKSSVRFLKADDPAHRDTYEFRRDQRFLDATRDGKALLTSTPRGRLELIRLDPGLWKRHLCAVLGRDLTADERAGLTAGLPTQICPN